MSIPAWTRDGPWRAPLCRWPEPHRHPDHEVDHNWEALERFGEVCTCPCHDGEALLAHTHSGDLDRAADDDTEETP